MFEESVDSEIELDLMEVYRQLGYPAGAVVMEPIRDVCEEQIRHISEIATPWHMRCKIAVQRIEKDAVTLAGSKVLFSSMLAKLMRRAVAIELLVVTLGERVSEEIRFLTAKGDMMEALALDAVANSATNALIQNVQRITCAEAASRGLGTTIRYGPGYTGWALDDIKVLFSCLDGRDMPVRLNAQDMLVPEKSLIGIVGLVPGGRIARSIAPCRICDQPNCPMRREPLGKSKRTPVPPPELNNDHLN